MQNLICNRFLNKRHSIKTGWLLLILVIVFVPHLFISHRLLEESFMQDLRGRIIGSRLLEMGRSPYFFKWHSGDDTRLFDPNILLPFNLNSVTTTPFYLWLQKPLARLDFCQIKFFWWIIEELALFFTLILTCLVSTTLNRQIITIIISTFFFCYSRNWWLHLFNGQYYIFFGLFFALLAYLYQSKQTTGLVVIPLMVLIRPLIGIACLPWLLKDTITNMRNLMAGGAIAIILLMVSGTFKIMPEYTKAMKYYSSEVNGWDNQQSMVILAEQPKVLEVCVEKQSNKNRFEAGCLFPVQHYMALLGVRVNNSLVFSGLLLIFVAVFVVFTGCRTITSNDETKVIVCFLMYIFAELFTPANRNPYNMVQYLGILGLVINRASTGTILLLVGGLLLNHDFPFRFAYQREIGEIIILGCIYLSLKYPIPTNDSLKYTFRNEYS